MCKFTLELPKEIMADIQKLYNNSDEIFGGMTKAAAELTLSNVKANAPMGWKDSNIMNNIGITRVYKTPSDGGINTKVIISGYFTNHLGKKTPAPLVANVFEYGSSKFIKQPFFRKSFKKKQIEQAMFEAQSQLSGGLLDE